MIWTKKAEGKASCVQELEKGPGGAVTGGDDTTKGCLGSRTQSHPTLTPAGHFWVTSQHFLRILPPLQAGHTPRGPDCPEFPASHGDRCVREPHQCLWNGPGHNSPALFHSPLTISKRRVSKGGREKRWGRKGIEDRTDS